MGGAGLSVGGGGRGAGVEAVGRGGGGTVRREGRGPTESEKEQMRAGGWFWVLRRKARV